MKVQKCPINIIRSHRRSSLYNDSFFVSSIMTTTLMVVIFMMITTTTTIILVLCNLPQSTLSFTTIHNNHHNNKAVRRTSNSKRRNNDIIESSSSSRSLLNVAITTPDSSSSAESSSFSKNNNNNDNNIVFPPPLSTVDRIKRATTFWSTALPIVASYYGLISRLKLQEIILGSKTLSPDEEEMEWKNLHSSGAAKLSETITNLKGFYVKTAQIISSRRDLFPEEYTDALSGFTDNLDPMPVALAKAVICAELLNADETFDDIFTEFDDKPLGAASVAQVHRAVLSPKYGGPREVAVKIQRPSIESKLMGDIANLKALAKTFRNNPALPLDYYTVMCELEVQLQDEFDFIKEAVAMDRIYNSIRFGPDGQKRDLPLVIPRPVPGLISRRVLVQDYLHGIPLSRLQDEMKRKNIDPNSPESKLFGRKLLVALTEVFGRTILETGFFHADPHPGNIFVLEDGQVGLIDYGQVKQISGRNRETLCKVMIALDERRDDNVTDMNRVGNLALELGVELKEDAQEEAAAAVGIWLFDGSVDKLPGGYDLGELSPNSPVKELKSFPQDLVLVGRSSILIKGLSNRLNIPWSLAKAWAPIARQVLDISYKPKSSSSADLSSSPSDVRVRFYEVVRTLKLWGKGRATQLVRRLPPPMRTKVASIILKYEERKARKALMKRQP